MSLRGDRSLKLEGWFGDDPRSLFMRSLIVASMVMGLAGTVAAQKPHAQNHHPKQAEHKAAPVALPKAGAGANGSEAQLKRLEQQTSKTAGAKPQKVKAPAPAKYKAEPAGANKNAPIDFKPQHAQANHGGNAGVKKNTLHARH